MATASRQRAIREVDYPTGDGKPMAETDVHRDDMVDVIQMLRDHFADEPDVYVSGNLLMFYVEGDRRKHISPDVFVVRGVEKKDRDHYLVWKERKAPDAVIEITLKSTRRETSGKKGTLPRGSAGTGVFSIRPHRRLPRPAPARIPFGRRYVHTNRPGEWTVAERSVGFASGAGREASTLVQSGDPGSSTDSGRAIELAQRLADAANASRAARGGERAAPTRNRIIAPRLENPWNEQAMRYAAERAGRPNAFDRRP